jgi:hypothetical protein
MCVNILPTEPTKYKEMRICFLFVKNWQTIYENKNMVFFHATTKIKK